MPFRWLNAVNIDAEFWIWVSLVSIKQATRVIKTIPLMIHDISLFFQKLATEMNSSRAAVHCLLDENVMRFPQHPD